VLKADETFVVLDRLGDIAPGGSGELGLYHRGTRFLSSFSLTIDGGRPFLLSSGVREDSAIFVADLTNPDLTRGTADEVVCPRGSVHLTRECRVGTRGMVETLHFRNYASAPVALRLSVALDADFADIFEVRGTARARRGERLAPRVTPGAVSLSYRGLDDLLRVARVSVEPAGRARGTSGSSSTSPSSPARSARSASRCRAGSRESASPAIRGVPRGFRPRRPPTACAARARTSTPGCGGRRPTSR